MNHVLAAPIIFMRHGQTDWDPVIYPGEQNLGLNDKGITQVNQASYELMKIIDKPNIIIATSPLNRSLETTQRLMNNLKLHYKITTVLIPELKERCYYAPYIQTDLEFYQQGKQAWSKIQKYFHNKETQLIVVTHHKLLKLLMQKTPNKQLSFKFGQFHVVDVN